MLHSALPDRHTRLLASKIHQLYTVCLYTYHCVLHVQQFLKYCIPINEQDGNLLWGRQKVGIQTKHTWATGSTISNMMVDSVFLGRLTYCLMLTVVHTLEEKKEVTTTWGPSIRVFAICVSKERLLCTNALLSA